MTVLVSRFESWLIPDGNYPPLRTGDLVRLAFEVVPEGLFLGAQEPQRFESIQEDRHRFAGRVLGLYADQGVPVAAVEAASVRFYVRAPGLARAWLDAPLAGTGSLQVDCFVWTESIGGRDNTAPDLLMPLRVRRIRSVRIPERYVTRSEKSVAAPASVDRAETSSADVHTVESMVDVGTGGSTLETYVPSFFLVDFDDADLPNEEVPPTFLHYKPPVPKA
jgi:hypothetical protein